MGKSIIETYLYTQILNILAPPPQNHPKQILKKNNVSTFPSVTLAHDGERSAMITKKKPTHQVERPKVC